MITYVMERKLTFEEMCQVVLRFRKDGLKVIDHLVDRDNDQMYICMQNSTEEYELIIDEYDIKLGGFAPREALEKYEMIIDCLEIE